MKKLLSFLVSIVLLISIFGCSGGGGGGVSSTSSSSASGTAQKGPFAKNSTVTAYKLVNGERSTTQIATTKTTDNKGSYTLSNIAWSGATEVVISGRYFNEVSGSWSSSDINLSAIIDVEQGSDIKANINILTDMASKSIINKLKSGASVDIAKKEARDRIKELFKLPLDEGVDLEDLDILDGNSSNKEANAVLLQVSAAVLKSYPDDPKRVLTAIANDLNLTSKSANLYFEALKSSAKDSNLSEISAHLSEELNVTNPPSEDDLSDANSWSSEYSNTLNYKSDINISVSTKGSEDAVLDLSSIRGIVFEGVEHGRVDVYLVGNEIPTLEYTSTDCFEGVDSFIYINDYNETGVVNVTIQNPLVVTAEDKNISIYSDSSIVNLFIKDIPQNGSVTITKDPSYGSASAKVENGKLYISYTPASSSYYGDDFFEYTITADHNGCTKSAKGRIKITLKERVPTYVQDINKTINVKSSVNFELPINNLDGINITGVDHGSVNTYLIGNEIPAMEYVSSDCFEGVDTFTYQNALLQTGKVNITITNPITLTAVDKSMRLFNSSKIENEALVDYNQSITISVDTQPAHGSVTLSHTTDKFNFTYIPDSSYVGSDFFTYRLTASYNGCAKSVTGRVDLTIESVIPEPTVKTKATRELLISHKTPIDESYFGTAVQAEGDIVIVSAHRRKVDGKSDLGEVYIYKKTAVGVELVQTIESPTNSDGRIFGSVLSYGDGYLAISSYIDNPTNANPQDAKVYIYKKGSTGSFSHIATITSPNSSDNKFANSIAINRDYLVVGAYKEDGIGAVYVYENNNDSFSNPIKLQDTDNTSNTPGFGYDVKILQDLICVANPQKAASDSNNKGEMWVYRKNDKGDFEYIALKPPKTTENETLGFSTAIYVDNNIVAVSAPNSVVNSKSDAGRVFVYAFDGSDFVLLATVEDSSPVDMEYFGYKVAIKQPYLAISNKTASNKPDAVRVYQYTQANSYELIGTFSEIPTISSSYWEKYEERSGFGYALSFLDTSLIAGAPGSYSYTKLHTRAYKAGTAYMIDCNATAPYWIDYQREVVKSEGDNYLDLVISSGFDAFSMSGVGVDSGYFEYSADPSYSYIGYLANGEGDGGLGLSYDNPQDSDGNNRYEIDMKLTLNGVDRIYPLTWIVKEDIESVYEGYNSNVDWDSVDRYRIPSQNLTRFSANRVLLKNNKAYIDAKDRVVIFSIDSSKPEYLASESEAKLSDVVPTQDINITNTNYFVNMNNHKALFDVSSAGKIAVVGIQTADITTKLNSYIHLFNSDSSYDSSLVVHKGIITGCSSADSECLNDQLYAQDVKWDEDRILVSYKRNYYYKDANANESRDLSSGIKIYDLNSTGEYQLVQTIQASSSSSDDTYESYVDSFGVNGGYLFVNSYFMDGVDKSRSLNIYKYNTSSKRYELLQNITPPNTLDLWSVNAKDEYIFVEYKIKDQIDIYTDIYKVDSTQGRYTKIDTIKNADAGSTVAGVINTSGYYEYASGTSITTYGGETYLFKRFIKRGESIDYSSNHTGMIPNTSYIAIFKWDASLSKFRFLNSFTHRDSSVDFGGSFDVLNDLVISNTHYDNSGDNNNYLHTFKVSY